MAAGVLNLGLLLGGPSAERGISLNSARSVADHLDGAGIRLSEIIYFGPDLTPHSITRGLLYCNTPSDFDFKLSSERTRSAECNLEARLAAVDLVFPVIHGTFGEDGHVQSLLERAGIPFIGSSAAACAVAFDKFRAYEALSAAGITPVPTMLATREMSSEEQYSLASEAFPDGKLVLKPAQSGSSIDVHVARDRPAAAKILSELLCRYERVVVQPRMTGTEMTTIVLGGPTGPTPLMPIQIDINNRWSEDEIFDYRRKYLASHDAHYRCPPPQDRAVIAAVRRAAEDAFQVLGLRDFARIDGWLQPGGQVVISDVNPISGMEQNSFLFIQAAQLGMSHQDVLRFIVAAAAERYGRGQLLADRPRSRGALVRLGRSPAARHRIAVLFGGDTAERQVSVLTGTNVWLKLLSSERYEPVPHLLDPDGSVWQLSYAAALRHSVEEILDACRAAQSPGASRASWADEIYRRLQLSPDDLHAPVASPLPMTMDAFLDRYDMVFLGLHGGTGENGSMQQMLDARGIRYNGSGARASRLCMDKHATGQAIAGLASEGIYTPQRIRMDVPRSLVSSQVEQMWSTITAGCGSTTIIVKPLDDGCSAGVVPLGRPEELLRYLSMISDGARRLPGIDFSLLDDEQIVELPTRPPRQLLFEKFIQTDDIRVDDAGDSRLRWAEKRDTGWVEVTVAVVGPKGAMRALNPSITVVRQGRLSLEEKFMGGTGINITPPPGPPLGRVRAGAIRAAKARIVRVADVLGLAGYGRIDAFMHRDTGEIIVIEANTLPGLTPSTVFFQQCLAEDPPQAPREVLERLVDLALAARP
jgi:D-alanine--D-alanine ligase